MNVHKVVSNAPTVRQAALEAARGADAEERPHPETQIAGAGVHEESLEDVLVTAHVHAAESAGLVEMRARSLQQFTALAQEPLSGYIAELAYWRLGAGQGR
jgi:hypothetical protein